jgi:hypothetical protein
MEEDEKSIFGGACFPETVHTSEGNSISSGRMEITSGIPPVLHAHSGISPKRELAIQGAYLIGLCAAESDDFQTSKEALS